MSELLSGWGRAAVTRAEVVPVGSAAQVADELARAGEAAARGPSASRGLLVRGLGRSYNDAGQSAGGRALRLGGDLATIGPVVPDGHGGASVEVGAGASLHDLLAALVPLGWFVPVTPGTRHVTLGGAVAMDVHGKNHHRDGSLARHLTRLEVVDGRATARQVTPGDDLFGAVVGGLGLTGVVTRVTLRLMPIGSSSVTVHTTRTRDLAETMAVLEHDDAAHRYTVSWVDTLARGRMLGRGVVTSGDHSPAGTEGARPLTAYGTGRPLPTPPWVPSTLLSALRIRAFNEAYYRRSPARPAVTQQPIPTFFHPLDVVDGWNRLYGRRGFVQYQFVARSPETVETVLTTLQREQVASFLAVLKRFGPGAGLPLSFPQEGWTLTVDIPADPAVAPVLDRLDEVVAADGGRLYLAKDGRMRPELLPVMYPDVDAWRALRDRLDPNHLFRSDLARRLAL